MREAEGNPASNRLGAGVTEEVLQAAITKSGHPLQAAVVRQILQSFNSRWGAAGSGAYFRLQEEWTYQDRESGETRAVDALAEAHLWQAYSEKQPRVRPVLSMLVECKQSELPFVFFTRKGRRPIADYPTICGFPHDEVSLRTDDDPSTYTYPILALWGLRTHEFVLDPPIAVSLSKIRRKGSTLEITGEESYNSLTLPLMKAAAHLHTVTRNEGKHYADGRIVAKVAVVRAPMIAVHEDGTEELEAVPWIRVHRYEPNSQPFGARYHNLAAFDVVHEDFLPDYMAALMAYADCFSAEVVSNQEVLLAGRGFASGLGNWEEPRITGPDSKETQAIERRLKRESLWARIRGHVPLYGFYIREPLKRRHVSRRNRGK